MSRVFLIIAVLVLLLGGIFVVNKNTLNNSLSNPSITPSPLVTVTPGEIDYYSCSEDEDCISVRADGCGCRAGGKATSINKNFKDQWESSLPSLMCPQVMSNDPSCIGVLPRCVDNKCKLVESN